MISKDAIRDELVRAVEYGHITKEDLKWFDELFTPTPLDSEVEEIFKKIKFSLQCIDTNGTARDSALNEIKKLEQYITPTPLDSEVEKAIKGLESMADWYVDANDYRDKFAQERLEKYITTIRQVLQSYQSQLNQVREVVKKSRYKKAQNIISELPFIDDKDLKYVISPAYSLQEIKQILGDEKNDRNNNR